MKCGGLWCLSVLCLSLSIKLILAFETVERPRKRPCKRIDKQMEELSCIHGVSIRCAFVLPSTSMTTLVHTGTCWCHTVERTDHAWPLAMPQKHELEPVRTSTIWRYSSMMRIYLHSVTTYNPVLQDSSSNPMLFRCFFFWGYMGQFWPWTFSNLGHLANNPFGKNPCLPSGEIFHLSKRFPSWEVNLPKNQKMVDPKMQMLGDSEDFDLASEKLGALPTKVLERGAVFFWKRWEVVDVFDDSGTWKDVGKNCWYLCCR